MFTINMGLYQAKLYRFPEAIRTSLQSVYGDCPQRDFTDFSLNLTNGSLFRKWVKPQIVFESNTRIPFKPLPFSQAYPLLEWGLNWCIATHDFNHLLIHAAVLVKHGKAIIFPALPGSGKSTLSCWLAINGWSLYSDEMAVIDTQRLTVKPLYRPACIKNESIQLVRAWSPDTTITPVCRDTAKGNVAHAKFSNWQTYSNYKPVDVAGIVFPKFNAEQTKETLYTLTQNQVFEELCQHAFNYHVLGKTGFDTLGKLVSKVKTFEVHYGSLGFMSDFLIEEVISDDHSTFD